MLGDACEVTKIRRDSKEEDANIKLAGDADRFREQNILKLDENRLIKMGFEYTNTYAWRPLKVCSSLAAGGALGYFPSASIAGSVTMNAAAFISICAVGAAGLLLLVALLINRYRTGRPGFFPDNPPLYPSYSKMHETSAVLRIG